MTISIIIVNYNGFHYTRQCIESLYRFYSADEIEVIVVDNNSSDRSKADLPQLFSQVKYIFLPENKGFGAANNVGAKNATGEFLFFLNNDTIILSALFNQLVKIFREDDTAGVVAPQLRNEDSSFQLSFGKYPSIISEFRASKKLINTDMLENNRSQGSSLVRKDWVTGAAMMVRKSIFEDIGGFDEQYFMYFEDSDLCKRVYDRQYSIWYLPSETLIHFGGKSYAKGDQIIEYEYRKSQIHYYSKHHSYFQQSLLYLYLLCKYSILLFNIRRYTVAKRILSHLCGIQ